MEYAENHPPVVAPGERCVVRSDRMRPDPKVSTRLRLGDRAALAFAAVVVVLAAASRNEPAAGAASRDLDPLAALLLVAALASTVLSRRFPGAVALVVLALSFAWYGVGYTNGLINIAILVAFYRLGAGEAQHRKLLVAVVAVFAVLVNIAVVAGDGWSEALTAAGYMVMAVLFGELVRHRHLLVEQYARRAEQAEADAHRRVAEERLRIARDLHDVLAHTVSAMVVQAGVAADRVERDPEGTRAALRSIREAGRQAMGEVQATVAVLRSSDDVAANTMPAPRIDRIAELADAARGRGLAVELDITLSGRPLPELVELTVYRVVQESLTNVGRHARASAVVIAIREEARSLTVEVRDDGHGTDQPDENGFGLRGMAERVESIGGELWHGGDTDGGWVVRVSMPLTGRTP